MNRKSTAVALWFLARSAAAEAVNDTFVAIDTIPEKDEELRDLVFTSMEASTEALIREMQKQLNDTVSFGTQIKRIEHLLSSVANHTELLQFTCNRAQITFPSGDILARPTASVFSQDKALIQLRRVLTFIVGIAMGRDGAISEDRFRYLNGEITTAMFPFFLGGILPTPQVEKIYKVALQIRDGIAVV